MPRSPVGVPAVDAGDRRDSAGDASATSTPSRLAKKLGVHPPPPIDIPASPVPKAQDRSSSDLDRSGSVSASSSKPQSARLPRDLSAQGRKEEDGEEQQRAVRELERQDEAELSSDQAMAPSLARRSSIASTRQSNLSTVSVHSYHSMENIGGLGSPGGSVPSGRGGGSDSNSDSDEFFDAVALDTDTDGGTIRLFFDMRFCGYVGRPLFECRYTRAMVVRDELGAMYSQKWPALL